METIKNLSVQNMPQELAVKLQKLTKELSVEQIFFHAPSTKDPGHLIIISGSTKNIEVIEARKWLRHIFKDYRVLLHVLGSQQIRYGYKNGHPFIPSYCIASTKVYQNTDYKFNPPTTWKGFKKRYKKFERDNFYEHDVLITMNTDFYRLEARTSVFLTYINIYEHHVTYLEKLYIGHSFNSQTLSQRIKYLSQYLPAIEGLFVKQNGETYYLIVQLEKAKEAAQEADEMYINWELYAAINDVERQLCRMVSDRLWNLKKRIKANNPIDETEGKPTITNTVDQHLLQVISQINNIKQPEEIYLFHKTQTPSKTNYYLLLIGKGLGTETLNTIQQSVMDKFNEAYNIILIGHSRIWIQEHIFIHQEFFKNIMTPENRVYKSQEQNFTIHWENPYISNYGDLDYMYKATNKMISNYFVLREFAEKENAEGVQGLFSIAMIRLFRTFVFAKLSYQPHYLSAYNLWMLCLYAQPNLGKIAYLFEKLSGDTFFKEVDRNSRFNYGLSRIPKDKGLVMDEILKVLMNELTLAYNNVNAE